MSTVVIPALDSTMGATFVGVLVGAMLYGVSCLQTWHYYREYSHDAFSIKLMVGTVWLCDTVHQILISHTMYTYVITNFANPAILGELVWSLIVEVLFNGFTAVLVQCFFTLRIYRLSNKNIPITAVVLLFVIGQFGVTMAYAAKAIHMTTFAQLATLKGLSMSVNALTAASDVSIAVALCSMLHRSRTGFRASDSMINKLIIFTMNTGLLTRYFLPMIRNKRIEAHTVHLVLMLFAPLRRSLPPRTHSFIFVSSSRWADVCRYLFVGYPAADKPPSVYSNSLLATLNARKAIRNGASSNEDTISLQGIPRTAAFDSSTKVRDFLPIRGTISHLLQTPGNLSIKIDTTHEYSRDNEYGSALETKKTSTASL
ncbi:hypothetical protein EVG20_g2897 [Dentipellis fragilis]|uniref:DUF6534 domain-containing protein n=1 Tax=Dentipellis fragilis TaxID=205917 RepID=A0A4Y9Z6D5_9AGAM|nr:hypothetical protein EVG20_g2897 [Dentipellis fragilis]